MSSRASKMLKENMEYEQASYQAIRDNQDAVLKVIRILADCGEIIISE
jgi:flagellar motor switch protein FliG